MRQLLVVPPFLILLALIAYSFASPALVAKVDTFTTLDNNVYLHTVTATMTNTTNTPVVAHVLVEIANDHPTGFWFDPSNNNSLDFAPHQTRVITLHQPAWTFAPRVGDHWLLEVFTANPQTLSTSVPIVWNLSNSF